MQITQNAYQRESAVDQRYKYNGNELQPELDLYDFNARFFDPALGRFSSIDPLATYEPGWTPYRYAFNNPIRYSDPAGLLEVDEIRDIFNKAPSGRSSYNSDGECTCGCPGKPPCPEEQKALAPGAKEAATLKFIEEVGKRSSRFFLKAGSFFISFMFIHDEAGKGAAWSNEDTQKLNELSYKESQGTLTDQEKRNLQDLREGYIRLRGNSQTEPVRQVSDLELTHSESLITNSSSYNDIKNLSNEELINSVRNPKNGKGVLVNKRTGKVVDGNTRLYELRRRGLNIVVPFRFHDPGDSEYFPDLD